MKDSVKDKIVGCLYGQAVGDALGFGTEFMSKDEVKRNYPNGLSEYSQMVQDYHRKRWGKGDWTDDTDMMLCIANAVVKDKGVNLTSIAQNFKDWAMGEPMGIGETTYKVLILADYVEKPFEVSKKIWEMGHRKGAANGGLMRTSVVGTFPKAVEECAANICRLTHYDPRCVGSCVIISLLIHSLIYKNVGLSYHEMVDIAMKYDERIVEFIDLPLSPDIRTLELQDEDSVGYTLRCLSVALWAYWHARSFTEGLLAVVRAGGDADTNAAVACAVLGAKYGYEAIPNEYKEGLIYRRLLDSVIEGLICLFYL